MGNRRESLKNEFKKCGFNLKNSKDKADEYESDVDHRATIYFYWSQGKDALNLAIDPAISYENLLKLEGVSLQKTRHQNGIRFGTTMKKFPFEYNGIRPDNPTSRVGRMFQIEDSVLSVFLNTLVFNINSKDSISLSKPLLNKKMSIDDSSHLDAPSKFVESMQLAAKEIDAEYKNKPGKDVDAIVKRRVGQSEFRSLLEAQHGSYCHVSRINNRKFLIASHIVPWSKSEDEEKTDPNNGLLLAVNWDTVFDKGFICFGDDGKVLFSEELDDKTSAQLGLDKNVVLSDVILTDGRKKYLQRHREIVFECWKRADE